MCLWLGGCGGGSNPVAPPPPPAQVAGVWHGSLVGSSVTGACVATQFQRVVGVAFSFTITIQQSGSQLAATVIDSGSGSSCTYAGIAGPTSVALNMQSCQIGADLFPNIPCSTGAARDIQLAAGAITGTVNGNTMSGTDAQGWNTFFPGTSTATGTMYVNGQFNISR